jgi:isocitrate/isopropylmalate dehydrogenase
VRRAAGLRASALTHARPPQRYCIYMPSQIKLAVIPGDGIGPEVVAEALKVLMATGVDVSTTEFPFGAGHFIETGTILEDSDIEELATHDAILLGAVGASSNAACCSNCGLRLITTSTCARRPFFLA